MNRTPELVLLPGMDGTGRLFDAFMRSVLSVDASERLAQVDVPVLCLRAARDVLVPSTAADWIQRVLPGSRIVDVDGPHGLLQASPDACARLVEAFLAGLPESP